jgi:ABC-type glycerol-3-phosphate transport system substrate-binding protein
MASASLMLLPGLSGCAIQRALPQDTLHITVVPLEGVERRAGIDHADLASPVVEAFRRLNPSVDLRIRELPERQLSPVLRQQQRRGLGPDLLLVRAPVAVSLRRAGLVDPVPDDALMRQSLASLEPLSLVRVREQGELAGMPVAKETTLACYDTKRVPQPPRTLDELLTLAASGRPIGIAVNPIGIWWTAGPFRATRSMIPVITGHPASPPQSRADQVRALEQWLQWLRKFALQSRVDIATGEEGSQQLVRGLINGRLAWIPCYSLSLLPLSKAMGSRLGVGVLPSGPDGPASPFSSERVWAFGTDSSPRQRQLAEALVRLSVDPMLQRQITLANQATLPVNRFTNVPVAGTGRLAAMALAQEQFRSGSSGLGLPFSATRVQQVLPRIEATLFEAMVGVLTPTQAAEALLRLENEP